MEVNGCECFWWMSIWRVEEEKLGAYMPWPENVGMIKDGLALVELTRKSWVQEGQDKSYLCEWGSGAGS